MATYVLIPGAGGDPRYWHLVGPELRSRGHDVVAVDLPGEDDTAGLDEYTETVVDAVGDRTGLILVAQSLGGFTAPLVCRRLPVDLMVLLAAMIPSPGERGADWWGNTEHTDMMRRRAEREGDATGDDMFDLFFHDLPPELAEQAMVGGRDQSATPLQQPWPLPAWPDVPTRVLVARDDRFFPVEFMRRVAQDRLGITPDEMPGGHLVALSQPHRLAERLDAYRLEPVATEPGTASPDRLPGR